MREIHQVEVATASSVRSAVSKWDTRLSKRTIMDTSDFLHKYPRTAHIETSRHGDGDDLDDVGFDELKGQYLVIEEKIDGANAGLSFTADGQLRYQSRGHYLTGGPRERQFAGVKSWAASHQRALWDALGDQYVCYGEWAYAKHTVFYDRLPHYFCEFDVMDRSSGEFLDTKQRHALLADTPVVSVPVLSRGVFSTLGEVTSLIGPSLYKSEGWLDALAIAARAARADVDLTIARTDPSDFAEGLYLKAEAGGLVTGRYKWVRGDFVAILASSDRHWLNRPIVANGLGDVDLFDPSPPQRALPGRTSS